MDKKRCERIQSSLKAHRADFEPHFAEIEKFMSPRRGNFKGAGDPVSAEMGKRGKVVNSAILNSTPVRALRILKSGMQAGMTSQSRPWFKLEHPDPGLRKRPAVKEYVEQLQTEARLLLARSGMYNALHTSWGDLGAYGTEAMLIEDSDRFGLRPIALVPGSYWLGASDHSRIDTLFREFRLTVNQIVGKFVFNGDTSSKPDWSKVSPKVKQLFEDGDIGELLKVSHLITPRHGSDRDPKRMDGANKAIASKYWMDDTKDDQLMGDLGYDRNPISASRWEVQGYEVYGRSPGMDALPDCKELMSKRRDYAEMMRRMNRPTMNAHIDMRNSAFSMMPGAVNFMADPSKGLQPAFQVSPQFGELRQDMEQTKDDIWSSMYADLFMMISSLDRRQITATEIDERREEKLLALGPVVERSQFEKLDPLVDMTVARVIELGLVGPPPEELQGEDLNTEFVGMLAQAQRAVSTGAIERLWGFAGNMAAIKPEIMDKLDGDKTIDEYAGLLGVAPSLIVSTEAVQNTRAQRQQTEQAMMMAEQAPNVAGAMKSGAEAARLLSEADGPRGGAPTDVLAKAGLA